jgi:hypothetical protein
LGYTWKTATAAIWTMMAAGVNVNSALRSPGGCHEPSPAWSTEGVAVFGQYKRITRKILSFAPATSWIPCRRRVSFLNIQREGAVGVLADGQSTPFS